ncbi:ABC transporter permease [Allorhizobium sp. BGMRC 0089]|uniref:ABC transporter permease n=1 Tax=Allorhizobium sonneratiae TaxID=2934936 RepID=UPI002034429E|nr:ABC transporter permease [Allorhizobium sonneratiae]MCM2293377.1 ABC transporter permease [Allorhizobium sonneratiae]
MSAPMVRRLKTAFRLALRELRGGLKGFYIFLACIALGTGSIAAVNSVSTAITRSIENQGQTLLGGDIRFELTNRPASPEELGYLQSLGKLTVTTSLRSMARLSDGSDQALVDIKAVDQAYPLYGHFVASPDKPLSTLLAETPEGYGAVVAPLLLDRLRLKLGDTLMIGAAPFVITGTVATEPDAASDGIGFAPRILVAAAALKNTHLIQTGSLVQYAYKIRLGPGALPVKTLEKAANERFPDAGWATRTRYNAAPGLTDNITRFSQFLTLVGLTALIVGGVGVANAVRAFLDSKRSVIATLKCLGAPAFTVVAVYLFQIMLVASLGIAAGLLLGAVSPWIACYYLAQFLPIHPDLSLYPGALLLALVFGALTTLAFALMPLGRAREVPATALFREQGFEARRLPSWPYVVAAGLAIGALGLLAVITAYDRRLAIFFLIAMAASFAVLRAVAWGVAALARKSPRLPSPALRLAIGNIYRPGALTSSVILSLGLGLALLVSISMIDGNLRRNLSGELAEKAPNFFFIDIQRDQLEGFRSLVKKLDPAGRIEEVPMLRGRIVALDGTEVHAKNVPSEGRWVLRGDRGITYAAEPPKNATVSEGAWWAPDYKGEPLVSFSETEGKALGLKLGDTVTVNVLGRTVTAKIANFRKVNWQSLSINFVMIFSPNTFAGAPHAWIATLTDPAAGPQEEADIVRTVTRTYPTITSVRVKEALSVVNDILGQLGEAIRAAAAIALFSSVLVLSGALAAGNRSRTHDAVVLKTLGATRMMLIRAFTYEYLLLGLSTGLFALMAGSIAGWFVVNQIMKLPAVFLPTVAIATVAVALIATIGIGLIGTWRVLGQKAAPVLREL